MSVCLSIESFEADLALGEVPTEHLAIIDSFGLSSKLQARTSGVL